MLKTYWETLAGFRRLAALCVALLGAAGLAEAVGVAALLPLLSGSLGSGNHDELLGLSGRTLTAVALGVLVGLGIVASLLRFAADYRMLVLSQRLERGLRMRMMSALLNTRYSTYLHFSLGDAVKLVLTQGAQVGVGASAIVTALGNLTVVGAFIAMAAVISVPMTAITLGFGALTGLSSRFLGRRAEHVSRRLTLRAAEIADLITELLSQHKYYRSTGRVTAALGRAEELFTGWRDEAIVTQRYSPLSRVASEITGLFFLTGVLGVSLLVADTDPVEVLVFLALFYRLAPRLQGVQQSFLQARSQMPWWEGWLERYEECMAHADTHTATGQVTGTPTVTADTVLHQYAPGAEPALDSVSWELPPGGCVALVGESGSGKTTMLDIVTGLLSPTSGAVLLDGVPLSEYDVSAWQRRIGLVMQQTPIFFGSVLDNIAWSDPEPDVERAWDAARAAEMASVIAELPEGMQTPLGQHGGRLSGGQRQRLALARAIYSDPALLILDEATSALDSESELAVQESLQKIKGRCSILLVAHRLSTVRLADHIVVLSRGTVVEEGSWEALAARGGLFTRMLELQGVPVETSD